MLPYSREVYYSLFAELNRQFPLLQVGALLLGLLIVYWLLRPHGCQRRSVCIPLSALWAGVAYFWYFRIFADINFLAPLYAACAAAQALAFGFFALLPSSRESIHSHGRVVSGGLLMLALLWPAIDLVAGEGWPMVRMPGLHVVPLLLLTLALLVRLRPMAGLLLGVIPLLLSVVSAYEAYVLPIPQDWLPLVVSLLVAGWLIRKDTSQ